MARISRPKPRSPTPEGGLHLFANLFKYHAACYLTHAPIECARRLREEHRLTPEAIAGITLRLDASCERVCNIPAPVDGLQSKFSLRQTVAMALAGVDTASLGAYSAENARDPGLVGLRERVEIDWQDSWPQTLSELEIELADGRRVTARHDAGIPAADIADQGGGSPQSSMRSSSRCSARRATRELRETIAGLDRSRRYRRSRQARRRLVLIRYSAARGRAASSGFVNGRSCCSEGTMRRALAIAAGSMRALTMPAPSPASASTSPQGSTISEWP